MRSQWYRVRELFERVLDERPADLDEWLARECPDSEDLRAEVKSLFEHHSSAGDFLVEPIATREPSLMDEEPSYPPGHVIGPYTIVRELGRGGMGRVYLATDAALGRRVALKALPPAVATDPSQRDRLRREARAAASLNHPGICTVYALVEHEGELFIAAEYVEGHTLRDEIASGRAAAKDVLRTAHEIAAALASAHAGGVIHRDLKPENVMRTHDGRLKIVDFGLARIDAPAFAGFIGTVTQEGVIVGTPGYMAPEQLNGERGDARVDVFAYGVFLYEYACGIHPFAAATPSLVAARIQYSEAAPLDGICPDLPHHLTTIVNRCLMKPPQDRFDSAAGIVAALAALARVEVKPVRRWWRIHQAVVIGLYFLASVTGWLSKEWYAGSVAVAIFTLIGMAATAAGLFRGHVLFTERLNQRGLAAELRRTSRVTIVLDLLMAAALVADSAILWTATDKIVAALLIGALGIVVAIVRLVFEPSTTKAAFPDFVK